MTANDSNHQTHRRRGVRASRAKLTHALTEAGLRTQAALSERIADLEGLETAPKDLVNRAFRELPVDPQTLDRIATALGVDAPTLYKTSDEVAAPAAAEVESESEPVHEQESTTDSLPRAYLAFALALGVVAIALIAWFALPSDPEPADTEVAALSQPADSHVLSRGPLSLVVLPLQDESDEQLSNQVRTALAHDFSVATPTATAAAQTTDPQALADSLRVDLVIFGEIVEVGSLSGIRVYRYSDSGRRQIWAESLPTAQLESKSHQIASHIARAVRADTENANSTPAPHFPLATVQDDYLQGQLHLGKPTSELNIKRAQSRFSAALRQDGNYARAHAGLCMALLEEFWMDDEERAMNDAARTCGDATALAADDTVVAVAHAYFLRRSGRSDEAIEEFERIVALEPDNAAALEGLAATLLDNFRQSGEKERLNRAIAVANRSVSINPDAWRPYNTLLSLHWFAGNIDGAIEAAENSIRFEENELVLVNLGTMYLCSGRIQKARTTYERAVEIAPESYIGDEFLGQAMYFLGDFKRSAELRRKAIDSIADGEPEIHEMWGNLGDSYRQIGNTAGAIGAYLQATKIAERDHLRGNAAIADRASRAYYYTMLRTLDRDTVADDVYNSVLNDLDDISSSVTEMSALRRLAQIWVQLGNLDKAQQTLAKVTATCPGYARMPDLAQLSESE